MQLLKVHLNTGCGSYTYFAKKFAVDQLEKPDTVSNINRHSLNLNVWAAADR